MLYLVHANLRANTISLTTIRCFFFYCLVAGLATAEEVAKSLQSKLIITAIFSFIYDIPRIYLNVNLYGALCSFYYNVMLDDNNIVSFRHDNGKSLYDTRFKSRWKLYKASILNLEKYYHGLIFKRGRIHRYTSRVRWGSDRKGH